MPFGRSGRSEKDPPAESHAEPGVKYRSSQEIGFDATTIQGGLARPDIAIVTGNGQEGDGGLLKLRDSFTDRLALDSAEEVQ